jgi:hypothetical protein
MNIQTITSNKKQFLDLLLLGDESEKMIDRYLRNISKFPCNVSHKTGN